MTNKEEKKNETFISKKKITSDLLIYNGGIGSLILPKSKLNHGEHLELDFKD